MKNSATAAPINTKRLADLVSSLYARNVDFLEGRFDHGGGLNAEGF